MSKIEEFYQGLTSRIIKKPGIPDEEQFSAVLRAGSLIPPPIKRKPFYDPKKAELEGQFLAREIHSAFSNITPIGFQDPVKTNRFNQILETYLSLPAKTSIWEDTLSRAHNSGEVEILELGIAHLWAIGTELYVNDLAKEHLGMVKRASEERYPEYQKFWALLFYPYSLVNIRLDRVKLADFADFNPKRDNVGEFYRFLVMSTIIGENGLHRAVYDDNNENYPANILPNLTLQTIDVLGNRVLAAASLSELGPVAFDLIASQRDTPPELAQIARRASRMCKGIHQVQDAARRSLTRPDSKDFAEISEVMDGCFRGGLRFVGSGAVQLLGLNSTRRVSTLYRNSMGLSENSVRPELYQMIARETKNYAHLANMLRIDDVAEFLEFEKSAEMVPDFKDLATLVSDIFQKTSQKVYENLDPNSINMGSFETPDSLVVNFNLHRPMEFWVQMAYANALGEATNFIFEIGCKKQFLDWSILESPDQSHPDVVYLRDNVMCLAQAILNKIRDEALLSHSNRQEAKQKTQEPPAESVQKRGKFPDPVYELKRGIKARKEIVSMLDQPFEGLEAPFEEDLPKKRVVFSEGKKLSDVMKHVSETDAQIILDAIKEFNERGTGADFGRLTRKGRDGQPRYKLSIGCTVPKGARVLLIKVEGRKGSSIFEVEDIRYRKDSYSKNQF